MARPLRIEYPGALYHVTNRGNERKPIFKDDTDRLAFLELLARSLERCWLSNTLTKNRSFFPEWIK